MVIICRISKHATSRSRPYRSCAIGFSLDVSIILDCNRFLVEEIRV
jgi:hypothetical protein